MSIEYSDRGKEEIVGTVDPGTNVNVTISIGDIRVKFNLSFHVRPIRQGCFVSPCNTRTKC